jgi:hypothetical protein
MSLATTLVTFLETLPGVAASSMVQKPHAFLVDTDHVAYQYHPGRRSLGLKPMEVKN